MSKKPEESAIDIIYNLDKKIDEVLSRLTVVEDNVKILNNKMLKLHKLSPLPPVKVEATHSSPPRQQNSEKIEKLVLGNVRVYGFIVNKTQAPLSDVSVNIYDSNSNLIKSLKTNANGSWEVRLPSGKFGVEYIHKKFKPVNKTIEVLDGTKEFEVK